MERLTHYEVLDIDPTASAMEIDFAYRDLAKKFHPDKGGTSAFFRQLQEAHSVLSNANSRREYDQSLKNRTTTVQSGDATQSTPTATSHVQILCSNCKTTQPVVRTANRFVCSNCRVGIRFCQCPHCDTRLQVNESFNEWTCSVCNKWTPSYWSTKQDLICVKCTTNMTFERNTKRVRCPSCSLVYSQCPYCGQYVVDLMNPKKSTMTCPTCHRAFTK